MLALWIMVTLLRLFFLAYSNANRATLVEFSWVTTFMLSTTPVTLWKQHKVKAKTHSRSNTRNTYSHDVSLMNNSNFLVVVSLCVFKGKSSNSLRVGPSDYFHSLYNSMYTLEPKANLFTELLWLCIGQNEEKQIDKLTNFTAHNITTLSRTNNTNWCINTLSNNLIQITFLLFKTNNGRK